MTPRNARSRRATEGQKVPLVNVEPSTNECPEHQEAPRGRGRHRGRGGPRGRGATRGKGRGRPRTREHVEDEGTQTPPVEEEIGPINRNQVDDLITERLTAAIPTIITQLRADEERREEENEGRDEEPVMAEGPSNIATGCSYKAFMGCKPKELYGNEGTTKRMVNLTINNYTTLI